MFYIPFVTEVAQLMVIFALAALVGGVASFALHTITELTREDIRIFLLFTLTATIVFEVALSFVSVVGQHRTIYLPQNVLLYGSAIYLLTGKGAKS